MSALQYDFFVIKKYNDSAWVTVSALTLPLLVCLYVYKILRPVDYKHVKKVSEMRRDWSDYLSTLCIIYAPIYYLIDSVCLIATGLAVENQCLMDMLYHHILSITLIPLVIVCRHIPSWQVGPACLHAVLITFPTMKWMHYPYLTIMVIFNVKIFSAPYERLLPYKGLKYGMVMLYAILILLWLHNCDNKTVNYLEKITSVIIEPGYSQIFQHKDLWEMQG